MPNMTTCCGVSRKPTSFCIAFSSILLGGILSQPAAAQQISIMETAPVATYQKPASAADRAAARRHIARGDDLAAHGSDWDVIAAEYRKALQRDPASAEAHYDLANSLHDGDQIDACILEYQQAIHLDMPDPAGVAHNPVQTADAYRQLGDIRRDKKQLISAVANYRASLKLAPNDAPTHESLAGALFGRELYTNSAAEYQTALRLAPNRTKENLAAFHTKYGNCLDQLKQYEAAATEYRTAVRLMPNSDVPHFDLACELEILGHSAEALRECREAIRLNPGDAEYYDELGVSLYRSGRHEEARIEWRKVLRMGDADAADRAREELQEYGA